MTKYKNPILYLFYALAVALVFLYYLFPEQEAIRRVTYQFERAYPPDRIHIAGLRPVAPATIRLEGVRIEGRGGLNLQVTRVDFSLRLFHLIGGQLSVDYSGSAYGGTFSGRIDFGGAGWDTPKKVNLTLSHLQLRQALMDQAADAPELSGTLDGEVVYHPSRNSADAATGKLMLTDVTLVLPVLSETAPPLTFSNVSTEFSMTSPVVSLKNTEFTGPQADGAMTGSLRIDHPLPRSRLDLTLKLSLHQAYRDQLAQALPMLMLQNGRADTGSYNFKIFGTLDKPGVSLFP